MINIEAFIDDFVKCLKDVFNDRLWFVGLQGSYARGEATENSDIDMVVILDELSVSDIEEYNQLLDGIPERNLMCGFISGKKELMNWNATELFQFYYDTKSIIGSLDELLYLIDDISIDQAIKTGACNIYHSCAHNMLYEKNSDILKGLYKSAIFIIQAVCFKQTGEYISNKMALLKVVHEEEKLILNTFLNLKNGCKIDFQPMSEILFNWCKSIIDTHDYSTIIGKEVSGIIDRPLGSRHPQHSDMIYPINYGYIPNVFAEDGEEQDVYFLGANKPITSFSGKVIAVYHRIDDCEDKWIVSDNDNYSDEEILDAIHFQEKYFNGKLYR